MLGGSIEVDSVSGQGSAFTPIMPEVYDPALVQPRPAPGANDPTLPPGVPAPAPAQRANFAMLEPHRPRMMEDDREQLDGDSRIILVVEDDIAFAGILFDLAHELGFQCLVADSADEGGVLARQYMPHAVILDMALPDHTGLSVLDRIKRDMRTRHIPVHVTQD